MKIHRLNFAILMALLVVATASYGQQFVDASTSGTWGERWSNFECHGALAARVKMDPSSLNGPDKKGEYTQWLQIKNSTNRTVTFALTYGATAAEANQLVVEGDLVDPAFRGTLKPGEMTKAYAKYVKNPDGMYVSVGFLTMDGGTTYENCRRNGYESYDPFCQLRPIEGCRNFSKIKEERAKIIKDPENEEIFENEAYGDLPDKTKTPIKIGGTQTGGGGTQQQGQQTGGNTQSGGQQTASGGQSKGQTSGSGGQSGSGSQQGNERKSYRYNSVCKRNFDFLQERLSNMRYAPAYDLFVKDANKVYMAMAQPCMSYDPQMKEYYDAAVDMVRTVDELCTSRRCTQWGNGEPALNETWFRAFQAEAQKAISDPNYSQELSGSVRPAPGSGGSENATGTGQGSASGGDGSGAMTSSSGNCQSGLDQLDREIKGINARRPQSASTIAQLQVLMYATSKAMGHIQSSCQGQPQYSQYAQMKTAYDQALNTCLSITSSPSYCVAKVAW